MLSQQKMRIFEGPKGPVYGSGEGREKKKNLPNLAPGAPFIGGQGGPFWAHTGCDNNDSLCLLDDFTPSHLLGRYLWLIELVQYRTFKFGVLLLVD